MQKRGRKSSKKTAPPPRAAHSRRAGGIGRAAAAAAVSIPPWTKLEQSSALEAVFSIKIMHGEIASADSA